MNTTTATASLPRPPTFGRTRTFRAADVRSALAAVKAELGSEAVILGTREVSAGVFRSTEIEITAATDTSDGKSWVPTSSFLDSPPTRAEAPAADSPLADVLLDHFLDRGIERSLARILTRRTIAGGARTLASAEVAARALIATKLSTVAPPWTRDRRRVIALVGPTGVGKTTTIAKLAARALLESRLKVALVTVDTYRIGASEQLARYGDIMHVPTFVARDVAQLSHALEQSAGADLVLVDTAGRFAEEELLKQARMLCAVPGIDMFLTMSLASSARDFVATADKYRFLNPERLILTKLDEAAAPGCFLSAAIRLGRPVTCITNGQRVPEDIHAVNSAQLVDLVMGSTTSAGAPAPSPAKGY